MEHTHHDELIAQVSAQLKPILDNSDQSVYIYLDDVHKICNKKFALLLGFKSADEWAKNKKSFIDTFVDTASQKKLVRAYQNAMEHFVGSSTEITWKKKNGDKVKSTVILVPFVHSGHQFAIHFIS